MRTSGGASSPASRATPATTPAVTVPINVANTDSIQPTVITSARRDSAACTNWSRESPRECEVAVRSEPPVRARFDFSFPRDLLLRATVSVLRRLENLDSPQRRSVRGNLVEIMHNGIAVAVEHHLHAKTALPYIVYDLASEQAVAASHARRVEATSRNANRNLNHTAAAGALRFQQHIHARFTGKTTAATDMVAILEARLFAAQGRRRGGPHGRSNRRCDGRGDFVPVCRPRRYQQRTIGRRNELVGRSGARVGGREAVDVGGQAVGPRERVASALGGHGAGSSRSARGCTSEGRPWPRIAVRRWPAGPRAVSRARTAARRGAGARAARRPTL